MRTLGLVVWLAAFLLVPAATAAAPYELEQSEDRLDATASENPGEYGIAALDVASENIISVNGNVPIPLASTMKIACSRVS